MKLLIDMNLSPRWVKLLTDAGIQAAHWSTLGAVKASDAEIMSFARDNGYIVLTHDLDFGTILAVTHGDKPSVVQLRSDDVSPDVIGNTVVEALRQLSAELKEGALLVVDVNRARLRMLPLLARNHG